jgi:hypothetical protein
MLRVAVWGTGNMPLLAEGGGNATAANRLLGALHWLVEQKPGIYDGLQVPLRTALPPEAEAARWAGA